MLTTAATLADMGTPLMWLGCGHLLFLNLGIGVLEGWLLSRWLSVPKGRAIGWMIVANYASAWIGYFAMHAAALAVERVLGEEPALYHVWTILIVLGLLSLLGTVVIETPFVLGASRGAKATVARRIAAGAAVQGVSYLPLAVLYALVSPMTLMWNCERVRDPAAVAHDDKAWVYYVNPHDGWVWKTRVSGQDKAQVVKLPAGAEPWQQELWLQAGDGSCDLVSGMAEWKVTLVKGLKGSAGDRGENWIEGPTFVYPVDFRPKTERPDTYMADNFAEGGLRHMVYEGQYRTTDWTAAMASPLFRWSVKHPTILPDGVVVFEMGQQIMVMDNYRHVSVLAVGVGPAVVRME